MNEMIERVAFAIHSADCGGAPNCAFEDLPDNRLLLYRVRAQASIQALREPTEAMLGAACDRGIYLNMRPEGWGLVWKTMIDEALK